MSKNILSKIVLLVGIVLLGNNLIAQSKPKPKFKPPVVKTFFGGMRGTTDSVTIVTMQKLIDTTLQVVDAKGNIYPTTHFVFTFKRIGVVENDSTGKVTPESDLAAAEFTTTPLPDIWRKTIKETVVAGEEIHFSDIIVTDNKGNYFYAPDVKIAIR
ncbi:MAG TPA: hypothetical protein VK559_04325 [Ferruginibacter sp.]|nr:hypothetical protein [Ferruginibacter sp.]